MLATLDAMNEDKEGNHLDKRGRKQNTSNKKRNPEFTDSRKAELDGLLEVGNFHRTNISQTYRVR